MVLFVYNDCLIQMTVWEVTRIVYIRRYFSFAIWVFLLYLQLGLLALFIIYQSMWWFRSFYQNFLNLTENLFWRYLARRLRPAQHLVRASRVAPVQQPAQTSQAGTRWWMLRLCLIQYLSSDCFSICHQIFSVSVIRLLQYLSSDCFWFSIYAKLNQNMNP